MSSQLILHKGGHLVPEEELHGIEPPQGTNTWFPKRHGEVLSSVKEALSGAGYVITKQALSVSHEGLRFFGTLDLSAPLANGVSMAVGIRNSNDQSFPIGFCAGSRVFLCDNLAFHSEIVISKKHTRFGETRYLESLSREVANLPTYQKTQTAWIQKLRDWELSPELADSFILQAYESGLIGPRLLPDLIEEYRRPHHEEFKKPTAWSLFNAFTEVLKRKQESQPSQAALTTIRLQSLLKPKELIINVQSTNVEQAG